MIEAVDSYGKLYERDLGAGSVMKLEARREQPGTQGGLMYPAQVR